MSYILPALPRFLPSQNDVWTVEQARDIRSMWDDINRVVNSNALGATTIVVGTHAERILVDPLTIPVGSTWIEQDIDNVVYTVEVVGGVQVWKFLFGTQRGLIEPDGRPTLGLNDTNYLYEAVDFNHTYRWSGVAWADTRGHDRDYVQHYRTAPSTGWHLCDGSANIRISNDDGTTSLITVPDEITSAPVYRKSVAAYTGPASTAPVAPVLSGVTGDTTATNQAASTGITVGAHTVIQITDVAGADNYAFTGATDANHSVNDPQHNHTQDAHHHAVGSLVVDTATQPRSLGFLPYIRL